MGPVPSYAARRHRPRGPQLCAQGNRRVSRAASRMRASRSRRVRLLVSLVQRLPEKSTLLKILSRITEPTEGQVLLRGRVASLLEVGTGFHPELTGRENIFLNGAFLGMTQREIRKKFDEIVAFPDVERFLEMPVKHYSPACTYGLALAVAAHLEPKILVVDEVLAVGDHEFQKNAW